LINGDYKANSGSVITPIKTEIFPFDIGNEKLLVRDVVKQITGPFLTLEKQIDETFRRHRGRFTCLIQKTMLSPEFRGCSNADQL